MKICSVDSNINLPNLIPSLFIILLIVLRMLLPGSFLGLSLLVSYIMVRGNVGRVHILIFCLMGISAVYSRSI